MNKAFMNYTKTACKATAVLSLAVFQVSFFLKPYSTSNNSIQRDLAQASEIGQTIYEGGYPIDLGVETRQRVDLRPVGEMVDLSSLPNVIEPKETLSEALTSYKSQLSACLVKPEDKREVAKLFKTHQTNSKNNRSALEESHTQLSNKLISLGLLVSDTTNEPVSDEYSEFDVKFDLGDEPSSQASKFLSPQNPEDLKVIANCHMAKLSTIVSPEEKKAYFQKYNVEKYMSAIESAESPEVAQQLAEDLQKQGQTADRVTGQDLGLSYGPQVIAQAQTSIQPLMAEVKTLQTRLAANPSDSTLQSQIQQTINTMDSAINSVVEINKNSAKQDPNLIGNPEKLNQVLASIDEAATNVRTQVSQTIYGQQQALTSTTVSPSAAYNPTGSITPTLDYNSVLVGQGSANYDPTNPLLGQTNLQTYENNPYRRVDSVIRPQIIPQNGMLTGDQSQRPMVGGSTYTNY